MSEVTTTPWPTADLPAPDVAVTGGVVAMWFGDPADPAVRLDPLPLADLDG